MLEVAKAFLLLLLAIAAMLGGMALLSLFWHFICKRCQKRGVSTNQNNESSS